MKIKTALTFDDVLLVPKYSDISTRSLEIENPEIDLSSDLGKGIKLRIPIISANMNTVTGPRMARAMAEIGGMGLLHRFSTSEEQVRDFREAIQDKPEYTSFVGCSLGINKEEKNEERAEKLAEAGCKIFCIDVAHGHHKLVGEFTEYLAKKYPDVLLIVGNVAAEEGTIYLYEKGADVVKAGIGSSGICLTRIETGNGVPQLTALENCDSARKNYYYFSNKKLISDGGHRQSSDIVKSLLFSDVVMLGNLLSGTEESPGEIIEIDGQKYKRYIGSSTHKKKNIEGTSGLVPFKGSVKKVISDLLEGVASGLSYQGAHNIQELQNNPELIQITSAGIVESRAHDIILEK